jgi:hypothetical protein
MSGGIAGFIDYDPEGKPYMGLVVEDGPMQVKIFIARREGAFEVVGELTRQLKLMAADLQKTHNKIQPVNGSLPDGAFRKS